MWGIWIKIVCTYFFRAFLNKHWYLFLLDNAIGSKNECNVSSLHYVALQNKQVRGWAALTLICWLDKLALTFPERVSGAGSCQESRSRVIGVFRFITSSGQGGAFWALRHWDTETQIWVRSRGGHFSEEGKLRESENLWEVGGELNCRMTPNNEETKKKIVDTSKRIEVSRLI